MPLYPLPDPQKATFAQEDAANDAAEARDCSEWHAVEGDVIRNLTTGRTGLVTCGLQDGRVLVTLSTAGHTSYHNNLSVGSAPWERANTEVIVPNLDHWSRR